jgi:ADP-heptose:LPS heptosyltransferase
MRPRVLIIKLGALGDVVLAAPHIERIIESHSDADIAILTAPAYAGIFRARPGLSVAAFPRKGSRAMLATIGWVRRQGFQLVYDLQGSGRSGLFTRLSGARVRVGLGPRYIYSHTVQPDNRASHIFHRLNRLLGVAGLQPAEARPVICVAEGQYRTGSLETCRVTGRFY